jgi:hypothetical protein
MSKPTGITKETYRRFLIDSGDVRVAYTNEASPGTLLSATRGGNEFTIETELREMPVDGAPGPVKGDKRIIKVTAKLKVNCIEHSPDIWSKALPGSVTTEETGYTEISRSADIATSDYLTNVAIRGVVTGAGIDGEYAILMIKNALCTGNFEVKMADKDEAVVALEFTGHFDPDDLDAEPWLLRHPNEAMTTEGA